MSHLFEPVRQSRVIGGSPSPSRAFVPTSPEDWTEQHQQLYIARDRALREKKRLDEIIMRSNPHSQDALQAIADLMHADKEFRRADQAWKQFIKDRLQDDPSWQIPET